LQSQQLKLNLVNQPTGCQTNQRALRSPFFISAKYYVGLHRVGYYAEPHCVDLERHFLRRKQMGRPLNKKYFGNRNIGTTGTDNDNGIGGQGVASVTISGSWSGFTQATSTVTFTAPELPGGVTATGTVTITAGAPTLVTITNKGSGYTSAPTVTIADSDVGAETTGTATAVLTTDTGAPGTTTNQENGITCYAFVTGGSRKVADIIKQVSTDRYKVKTADGTMICQLVTDGVANAAGEMDITAVDTAGKTYYVSKLTAHRARLHRYGAAGHVFPDAASQAWSFDAASTGYVQIQNA
jgi:hypothetical protein